MVERAPICILNDQALVETGCAGAIKVDNVLMLYLGQLLHLIVEFINLGRERERVSVVALSLLCSVFVNVQDYKNCLYRKERIGYFLLKKR